MSDQEKFEALKKTAIEENEKVYGNEIRRKYGEEAVDASYGKIRGMSQQEWEDFRQMEQEILVRLQTAVQQGLNPEGTEGRADCGASQAMALQNLETVFRAGTYGGGGNVYR